ncbi:MAG: NCS1 family nucleobase:cation symporter-1 [Planctomycetota bacterium]
MSQQARLPIDANSHPIEFSAEHHDRASSSSYFNPDLAPVPVAHRVWGVGDLAALWVGMSVCIPTYMLASGLIDQGMNWWQAVLTVFLGNLIVVVPMILNAHAGTKYGITFPVFARAAFGMRGANVAGLLRAAVACGWFGIQAWIGGQAIYQLALLAWPALASTATIGWLSGAHVSVNVAQVVCFVAFWVVNVGLFLWKGMSSIKYVEKWSAPILIAMGLALLAWAYVKADGFGPMLSAEQSSAGRFRQAFFPGLTAMVGFWATLSLNIPDFSRYAHSQRVQVVGQLLGLNTTMPFYAFVGVAVTSATVVIFGEAIWNPVDLLARFDHGGVILIAMFALTLATLTTNLAANVVAPATSFSNLAPRWISVRTGCVITGLLGMIMMPWKLVADPKSYIFTWLTGYSALLGPIGGILICDYFVIRRMRLRLEDLYRPHGAYWYTAGFRLPALVALVVAVLPNVPGFLNTVGLGSFGAGWSSLFQYAWFTGFGLAFVLYAVLSWSYRGRLGSTGD